LVGELKQFSSLNRPIRLYLIFFVIAWLSHLIQWESGLSQSAMILITAFFYILIFLVVIRFITKDGEPIQSMGLQLAGFGKIIFLAAAMGLISQIIWAVLISAATGVLVFDINAMPVEMFFAQILVMAFLTAFVEESAFRGYIQKRLTNVYGFSFSLVIVSILFMLPHFQVYSYYKLADPALQAAIGVTSEQVAKVVTSAVIQTAISITALGFFTGYLYNKSGQNVVVPVAFHTTFNIGGLFLLSFSNVQTASLLLDNGLFVAMWIIWTAIVAALVLVTVKKTSKS